MKTLFRSQDLWDLVEQGISEASQDDAGRKETQKKDAKALFFIQQAIDEIIFSRIAAATSANEAWNTLKTEYQGSATVITVKLQSLRRDFETATMKNQETIQEYLARISSTVCQIRAYGDKITDETVVGKILRRLPSKFDHVVAAIEESKDLSTYTVDELMGSLQTHEVRINRSTTREEDQAFTIQEDNLRFSPNKGRGRGSSRGRGHGRMSPSQCTHFNKYGHTIDVCWSKQKEAQYAEGEEEDYLFMATENSHDTPKDIWYLDSACSMHLTGVRSKLRHFDAIHKSRVKLGDNWCTVQRQDGEVILEAKMTPNRMFPVKFT
ncbi:uncharacterized protein LOC112505607, partial [Cynara cardunculus var. scolymus]|uniref:uncharacterized protein LOC112505607 n=1 Tax=Cynara cardunculus var. scolymus TaxID=59895 RepID=UPI000D630AA0